jgi:hypothetical protein
MLRYGALAAIAITAACSGTNDLAPFTIRLAFDTEFGGCSSTQCESFGMRCGARLSVRIVDANNGALLGRACEPIAASETACDLGELPSGANVFFDLPPSQLRIEVAAWSQAVLDADPTLAGDCPDVDIFDLQGIPLATFSPQPAFAGAAFFDAGSSRNEAIIPLACTDPVQLDTADCAPPITRLSTSVLDIERIREAEQDAASLLVRAAFPRTRIVDEMTQETETIIETTSAFVLERDNLGTADFSALVSDSISGSLCSLVLEQTPQATTTAICSAVPLAAETIELDSAFLPKPILDELLAAAGLAGFPEEGLLVGRVFDQATGTPVQGVSLLPSGIDPAQVQYLNSSRTGTIGDQTLDNGYFIATNIPFDTDWTVSGAAPMVPSGPMRGGLIRGQVTVLMVPLAMP